MNRKILITGANGFIGCHLVRYCLEQGDTVSCYVRPNADLELLRLICPDVSKIQFIKGTLEEKEHIRNAVQGCDVLFHLAGIISGFSQEEFDKVNLGGIQSVVEQVKAENPGISRIVYISSVAAAGAADIDAPLHEDDLPRPMLKYGISKYRGEEYLKTVDALPWTIIRPPPVYGAGDRVSLRLFQMAKKGIAIKILGNERFYSFVSVEDLVRGMYKAAFSPRAIGEIFFLAHKDFFNWSLLQNIIARRLFNRRVPLFPILLPPLMLRFLGGITEGFARVTGRKKMPYFNVDKAGEAVSPGFCVNSGKAEKLLNFTAEKSLEETLVEAGLWYLEQGWL